MRAFAAIVIGIISSVAPAIASDLGVVGKVYDIREGDALSELQGRAAKINWKKELGKIKPERYRPEYSVTLPRVNKSRKFSVDMTYTLDIDIPDGRGGVLYPKGYTFNPLDYVPFRKSLVIINAADKEQLTWFKQSPYANKPDVMLLITEGSAVKQSESLGRPVYFADSRIVDRFNLQAVPSVVRQDGKLMLVEEIDVRPAKKH